MKRKNRLRSLLLAVLLLCCAAVPGCGRQNENLAPASSLSGSRPSEPGQSERERFDAFVEELPPRLVRSDDMGLHFLFYDPLSFGFENVRAELPLPSKEDAAQGEREAEALLEELGAFDRTQLTSEQVLTLDVTKDSIERSLLTAPYYYLDAGYLNSVTGFQAQLPLLFNEYAFYHAKDVEDYLHLLESSKEAFHQYALLEGERQKNGAGMSKKILDKVIDQCDQFTAHPPAFLIDSFNEKMERADFLSSEEKAEAKKKNEKLVNEDFIEAYRALGEELSALRETAPAEELGLFSREGGKAYYEALFRQQTGIDTPIAELKQTVKKKAGEYLMRVSVAAGRNPALLEKLSDPEALVYSDFTSAEETLHYLQKAISEEFPALPALPFEVNRVPEAMADHFSPAAYLTSPMDAPASLKECIYVNGEYDQSLFLTLAHEGYPGHLYQNAYMKTLGLPAVRFLLGYGGYTEGWATYVENLAVKYAPGDQELLQCQQDWARFVQCQSILMDIGIHYEGWDKEDFGTYISQTFGIPQGDDAFDETYAYILENPTLYPKYYAGAMQFEELYQRAEEKLGEAFAPVDFHAAVLQTGPASFAILQQRVDAYVQAAKGEVSSAPQIAA